MKPLLLIACLSALAIAQTNRSVRNNEVKMESLEINRSGNVTHLTGNVRIETDAIVLRADAADFNVDTQEVHARGDVQLKLK